MASEGGAGANGRVMKTLVRFMMGFISSVLLSAGLSRAADRLDLIEPVKPETNRTVAPTPNTTSECNLLGEDN